MFQAPRETFGAPISVSIGKETAMLRGIGIPELMIFVMLFAFAFLVPALLLRFKREQLRHRERMAFLEKGVELPPFPADASSRTPRSYLLRGLIWLFSGIAITTFLVALTETSQRPDTLEDRLWHAQDLRAHGSSEEMVKNYLDHPESRPGLPIGLAFVGLIPIGVGAAYLVFYRGEQKQLSASVR
jgi:hypothetical protein